MVTMWQATLSISVAAIPPPHPRLPTTTMVAARPIAHPSCDQPCATVPPPCLIKQLGGTSTTAHSPQLGWAADGFPLYGPRGASPWVQQTQMRDSPCTGPGGTLMKTCTVSSGTYGTSTCTDDCGIPTPLSPLSSSLCMCTRSSVSH